MHEYERAWAEAKSYSKLMDAFREEAKKEDPEFQSIGRRHLQGKLELPGLDPVGITQLAIVADIAHKARREFGNRPEVLYQALTGSKLGKKDIRILPTMFGLAFSTSNPQEYYRTVSPYFSPHHLALVGLPLGLSEITPIKEGELGEAERRERDAIRKVVEKKVGRGIRDLQAVSTIQNRRWGEMGTALHEERHNISKFLDDEYEKVGGLLFKKTRWTEELWADWGNANTLLISLAHRVSLFDLLKIKLLQLRHRIPDDHVAALIRGRESLKEGLKEVIRIMEHNLDRQLEERHDGTLPGKDESPYGRWRPEPTPGTKGRRNAP